MLNALACKNLALILFHFFFPSSSKNLFMLLCQALHGDITSHDAQMRD